MTTIREATAEDVSAIVTMAQHFAATTIYGAQVPSDPAHLEKVVTTLMTMGSVLVAEVDGRLVGMIAGVVYPNLLSGISTAGETAWWVEPSARGGRVARALLDAFVEWGRAQGARRVDICSWNERLDTFYRRLGFTPAERVFSKEVT